MILFTLDIKKKYRKVIITYFVISILCFVINIIYSKFGHGVTSNYMTYMYLIPIFFGVGLFLILRIFKLPFFNRFEFNIYNAGVSTLIIGSLVHGILEIAGTNTFFQDIYLIVSLILILIAISEYLVITVHNKNIIY